MSKNIIITNMPVHNGSDVRTVSAIYDKDECIQLKIHDSTSLIGGIYLGRIDNIVKNINSAFVNIDNNSTCYYSLNDNKRHYFFNPKNRNIPNQGDSVLVQVSKDATKQKPATVTSRIELAGLYAVLSLDMTGVSVSKKINDTENTAKFSDELSRIITESCKSGVLKDAGIRFGYIIRSNFAELDDIQPALDEAEYLADKLQSVIRSAIYSKSPKLLCAPKPEYIEMIDDMPLSGFDSIITDDRQIFDELNDRYSRMFSSNSPALRLYNDNLLALYNLYDVKKQIDKALSRKVWLKSGGYIIIDYTEACTVIDVNSGKYTAKSKDGQARENAFYLINTQAAEEIAHQLRLRNISGMIIVDFINMNDDSHVQGLMALLRKEFKNDPINTKVVDITKLGLVEITRKREGAMLHEYLKQGACDEI